jgi:cholesterol oxidase
MGRRWTPQTLPLTSWSIHRWFWLPKLGLRGFFKMRLFRHATIFHGCAVGAGSITYASTLLPPPQKIWDAGSWTGLANWKTEMPRHFQTACHMLGVTQNKILGPADHLLKKAADAAGCGHTFYRTSVGIFQPAQGEPGNRTFPDPFFGGEGPPRTTCTSCGGCMMGCRFGAKSTLDLTDLYLAEKRGTMIFPETKVVNVEPLDGAHDGSAGYEIRGFADSHEPLPAGVWSSLHPHWAPWSCSSVSKIKVRYALSAIAWADTCEQIPSRSSGHACRVAPDDLSQAITIGSGIYIDEHTHIEAVRYPSGSDTMSLLTAILTDGRPGVQRIRLWLQNGLGSLLCHPTKNGASVLAHGMGAGTRDPPVHASAGGTYRDALATPLVLAFPQDARQPW